MGVGMGGGRTRIRRTFAASNSSMVKPVEKSSDGVKPIDRSVIASMPAAFKLSRATPAATNWVALGVVLLLLLVPVLAPVMVLVATVATVVVAVEDNESELLTERDVFNGNVTGVAEEVAITSTVVVAVGLVVAVEVGVVVGVVVPALPVAAATIDPRQPARRSAAEKWFWNHIVCSFKPIFFVQA